MKQDDLQKTLEAVAKSGITVNGDLVLEKRVEYEVGNVEDGGIGIQIINGKDASPAKSAPHFPLNKSEEEGKQWYEFLVKGGFIANDTALGCWQYYMGFSVEQPEELRPIAWLKTVETARMMIRKIHGNLIDAKKLSVVKMEELASKCFTKQGEPLKLAKPKKEFSADADEIENFLPTISDL